MIDECYAASDRADIQCGESTRHSGMCLACRRMGTQCPFGIPHSKRKRHNTGEAEMSEDRGWEASLALSSSLILTVLKPCERWLDWPSSRTRMDSKVSEDFQHS